MVDIDEILQELKDIKNDIAEAKQEKAKLEGVLSEHLKSLKNMGIKSVADGHKKVKTLKAEIEKLESAIQKQFSSLQQNYEW